ncbi:hypothetical protein M0R45_015898 [Rubus argutus]|uniref:Uncharacterized protein n=1 Tax=Rubus argutus TaxID=59490 RepID=A0AAW1XR05_RUBAR
MAPDLRRPATSGLMVGQVCFASSPPSRPDRFYGESSPVAAATTTEKAARNKVFRRISIAFFRPNWPENPYGF